MQTQKNSNKDHPSQQQEDLARAKNKNQSINHTPYPGEISAGTRAGADTDAISGTTHLMQDQAHQGSENKTTRPSKAIPSGCTPEAALSMLASSLEESFSFYHLGKIERTRSNQRRSQNQPSEPFNRAVAIKLTLDDTDFNLGDPEFFGALTEPTEYWLAVLFHDPSECSLYAEVANVFASRLASKSPSSFKDLLCPSPPIFLNEVQTKRIEQTQNSKIHPYVHIAQDQTIPLGVLVFCGPKKEIGNA